MTPEDLFLTPAGLRFLGRLIPCSIGRGGVSAEKREGDGATPAGLHRITGCYYRPDRIRRPALWAQPIGPGDLWCDKSGDPNYNRLVKAPCPVSHEKLRRADPLYDIVLITDWNWPNATPGKGSAIFLHQWRRPGFATAGCIATSRENIAFIAQHARLGSRLIVPPSIPKYLGMRRSAPVTQV
ncbi:L,D-transpeptidase family protein [Paracoccus aerodenitrificans]|uniref:L,D-transpeptidase family protein n=1 Tax=Paracoccus aerodenitrificans TaxID=3017781 RepID=UPI0022F0BA48|nr:L,D-transpeptidase family protein [Paracoccus aerodenitrificans]WBU64043.1 L,D-transpeptidase family protein [Paracoccus aerodenitrificans]